MKKYAAYNLIIQSELPLPLPECKVSEQPDIVIRTAEILEPKTLSRTYDGVWYSHKEDSLFLKWETLGSFLIRQGKEIVISTHHQPSLFPTVALLGTVMAVAIHQQGIASLHGSSVLVDGAAVIFLGEKGQGKSTMAGYFQKMGHPLLSDDVCAIDTRGDVPILFPSFSKLKLWPDSMRFLDFQPEQFEKVHPAVEKRNISLDTGFSDTPASVAAIFILTIGSEIALESISGHKAVPFLLPHLIINRFPEHQTAKLIGDIYHQLTGLLQKVPLFRLTRPRNLNLLPLIMEMIKKQMKLCHIPSKTAAESIP